MGTLFENISFVNPGLLLFLVIVPILAFWYFRKGETRDTRTRMPFYTAMKAPTTLRVRFSRVLPYLRLLALSLLIISFARPQNSLKEENIKAEGIDIFLAIDLSSSMLAKDFKPDRLEVSKSVAIDFVHKRKHDRIGLAVFSGESFTQCPLTTDHPVIENFIGEIKCGVLEDGTAIGMGLSSAINRLKDSKAKSKVVILLTDGVNNQGYIKPETAAEIAKKFGIKIYTIGIGSEGQALAPVSRRSDGQYVFGLTKVEIDEKLLVNIAEMTGGRFYRATSKESLIQVYDEIDKLEKTEMEVTTIKRYSDEYRSWLLFGMAIFLLELLLRYTILRIRP